jgi:hypothetical protein
MIKQRITLVAAVVGMIASPLALADSNLDTDPYWKWSKIERTAVSDARMNAAETTKGTGADAVANPGNYYY